MSTKRPRPVLIAGPTAAGKSALALALAQRIGGVVINADSMQVYAELPILTAQPTPDERAAAPHRLYGHVPAHDAYSTGHYLVDVAAALAAATSAGATPIIVGGTGLYFKAVLEGLSPVPPIPPDVRLRWREEAARLPAPALHALLAARDTVMARRLDATDVQRVTRALEVIDATGQSLAIWQQVAGTPLLAAGACVRLVVDRPREVLRDVVDARFRRMIARGALEEVRQLGALGLDPALPAMRAIGVPPLLACVAGSTTLDAAIAAAQQDTRRYVKRQQTWLRKFMSDWYRIDGIDGLDDALSLIRRAGEASAAG